MNKRQVFTLRMWQEALDEGDWEWRGELIEIVSGDRRYFRDWSGLLKSLNEFLPEAGELPALDDAGNRSDDHPYRQG